MKYAEFRKHLEDTFEGVENSHSISYQLIDLTDLFQKISAIYSFARNHDKNSFHNPIIFQIVQTAFTYGVCVPIRRLADGGQKNEISLYKLVHTIKSNCTSWTRKDFVTWDGKSYNSFQLRREHQQQERQIIEEAMRNGQRAAWLPIGEHEEIEERHRNFDLLASTDRAQERSESDVCNTKLADHLLRLLQDSASGIVQFANVFLAHRVLFPPNREPEFDISLKTVEPCISALWKCCNVINSVFYDRYTTSDIVHSLHSFDNLDLPLVPNDQETAFIKFYESIKDRIEKDVSTFALSWKRDFRDAGTV